MFTYVCLLIAAFLAAFAIKEYQFTAKVVAFEFVMHKVIFIWGFPDARKEILPLLYSMYAAIEVYAIFLIYKYKGHFAIVFLIALNVVVNLCMIKFSHKALESNEIYVKFIEIYAAFPYLVGIIMVCELIYLLLINAYVSKFVRSHSRVEMDYLDRLLCVSNPFLSRRCIV